MQLFRKCFCRTSNNDVVTRILSLPFSFIAVSNKPLNVGV